MKKTMNDFREFTLGSQAESLLGGSSFACYPPGSNDAYCTSEYYALRVQMLDEDEAHECYPISISCETFNQF